MALTTIDTYGIKDGAVQIDDIGTLAGNLTINDSGKLRLGTGLDLQIFHDGSNCFILSATGTPIIQEANEIQLRAVNDEKFFKAVANGSVELYYDNSKKAYTTSGGFKVDNKLELPDGGATGTSARITVGTGDDLKIYHDGTNNCIVGNPPLFIRTNNLLMQNGGGTEGYIGAVENGAVDLYYDNSKKFETTSAGATVTGTLTTSGTGGGSAALGSHLDLGDSQKIRLGASDDLQIYHDGSNSYIADEGTGDIIISSGTITFKNQARNETHANFIGNGACELYYDNSLKLSTYSSGVSLEDHLWLKDSKELRVGDGSDLKIWHNGSTGNSNIKQETGDLYFYTGSDLSIHMKANGAVDLYYDNSKKFETLSNGIKVHGTIYTESAGSFFKSNELLFSPSGDAYIDHNETGRDIYFRTSNSSGLDTTALILRSDGSNTHPDNIKSGWGTSNDLQIYHDGTNSYIKNDTGVLRIRSADLRLQSETGQEYFYGTSGGGAHLYHANALKLQTTSTGVSVSGTVTCSALNAPSLVANMATNGYNLNVGDSTSGVAFRNRIRLGDGGDLQIFHDGTHSYIDEVGTGNLYIDANQFYLRNNDSANVLLYTTSGGAVRLNHNGSTKFETYNGGVEVFGDCSLGDNKVLNIGTGSDLQIYHNGTNSFISNGTGELLIRAKTSENSINCNPDGSVELYYDNGKKFETSSGGCIVANQFYLSDSNSSIHFGGSSGGYGGNCAVGRAGANNYHASGSTQGDLVVAAEYQRNIIFGTTSGTSGGTNGRWRFNQNGHFLPVATNAYELGSDALRVKKIWAKDITASGTISGAGKVLQVVHTQSTTQSSLGQNTWHEVLEASITPSSTSSKILIQGMITFSENAGDVHVRIYLDNDGAHIGSGSASGQGTSSHSSGSCGRGAWDCTTNPVTYLHSPNSTSSRTYSIRAMCSNGSFKLNRQINGNQNHANDNAHSTNLVLMEVSA